ncbi:dimethylaniline monooxygenase [Stachybotrys elegans]|uniref:Dimethylaniline monooxygenase n=1 Tax=Stachybotrys elegans TaxID=80388 RepID=A0A8K0SEV2_9HYPO|nr:dimethylaniline monooxygenase [Stachybotrys elegans]
MRVAIIGAGPSGLVTLKYLLAAHSSLGCEPVECRLFESQGQVGGTFVSKAYEDGELVSSRQLTTFSDFRHASKEDFLSIKTYASYLETYCAHFELWPYIKLNTKVVAVKRCHKGDALSYIVTYSATNGGTTEEWECDAVAVCSGLHTEPNIPDIKGSEYVPQKIHSSVFKSRKQFGVGKTVMIVGTGETGADIAHLAVTSPTTRVVLCHRDGFHFAPKRNPGPVVLPILGRKLNPEEPGIPIDVSRANMFDTTYVHPRLRNSMILWEYYNYYIKLLLWFCSGTTAGMDQWIGEISPERHHPSKIFFNKSMKVCPYISKPYRPATPGPQLWRYALRSALIQTPIPDVGSRQVDLAPWPAEINKHGIVRFIDNGRPEYQRLKDEVVRPDMIVYCTGYQQKFTFLESLDGQGFETRPITEITDVRSIWNRAEPTMGFIGFVRPSLGAIPPLAELQAQLWVLHLLAPHRIPQPLHPKDEPHYRLLSKPGARVTYGVDHESYAYQLALDMGSAPGLWDICNIAYHANTTKAWRLPLIWALGAHFNTKFRLMGPWHWDKAATLLSSDEFWLTITRRPLFFGKLPAHLLKSPDDWPKH